MDISGIEWLRIGTIVLFTALAAVIDVRTHRLPNWLTVSAFLLALVFRTATEGFPGLLSALGGFATGFGILLVLFLIGGGGGGDVKLMGAIGAWLGPMYTLFAFLLSAGFAAVGTVLLICLLVVQNGVSKVRQTYFNRVSDKNADNSKNNERKPRRRLMPYALPVALGTWLVLVMQTISQKH